MGSSSWSYFVPYDEDINAAVQRLRQQVFEHGDYLLLDDWELWNESDARIEAGEDPLIVEADRRTKRDALPKPGSIDELFAWNEDSGTHSIIDMAEGASDTPDFGTVSPLTEAELRATFGTTKPTHAQIAQWEQSSPDGDPIGDLRRRWEGLYIIVYVDDAPSELYFAGFSGD
ncbi:MAG TPA: hypothetical protein VHD90_13450 [Phototrophicaceae bacterium]|nr:hypothetical protein [Phototrophicaceae bacterium]